MKRTPRLIALLSLALAALVGCGKAPPETKGGEPLLRLLSESQYRSIIADVFGEQITVGGAFDPLVRTNGLLTVGASRAHVTPAGLEQFDRMARSIAAQVVSEENRDILMPCKPATPAAVDEACAARFFSQVGRLLYRRPLSPAELQTPVKAAAGAVAGRGGRAAGSEGEGEA